MGYKQAQLRKARLLKTYRKTKHSYGAGVWFNDDKGFYIRYSPSNTPGYTKALRRINNRKVRRARDNYNHGSYKNFMTIGGLYFKENCLWHAKLCLKKPDLQFLTSLVATVLTVVKS